MERFFRSFETEHAPKSVYANFNSAVRSIEESRFEIGTSYTIEVYDKKLVFTMG